MTSHPRLKRLVASIVVFSQLAYPLASYANLTLGQRPLYTGGELPPLVMLTMTKDHQLHMKAYNDYTDLDNTGTPETTYTHSFDYYGYFDSNKCYKYNTANNRFEPFAVTADRYCTPNDGQWSGNFLNWATMTRIDAIRKLLYGGMRTTDSGTLTVLERAYLPTDSHSFAKAYRGADVARLTPFGSSVNAAVPTASSADSRRAAATEVDWQLTTGGTRQFRNGDQIRIQAVSDPATYMLGYVTNWDSSGAKVKVKVEAAGLFGNTTSTFSNWTISNLTDVGLSICNLTPGTTSGANRYSHTNTQAPILRVARGDYGLWGTNERWQCDWTRGSNENYVATTGLPSSRSLPDRTTMGLGTGSAGGEYIARVEVCRDSLIGSESCKRYPSGVHKPFGLLHVYGEGGIMRFGLLTGSYSKNISGGVLRRNISDFATEVNKDTDGTFTSVTGLVYNVNRLRPYGYDYNDGTYIGADSCTYQQTGLVTTGGNSGTQGKPANEGDCSSWGNPIGESFLETLRYFAGKAPTPAFLPPTSTAFSADKNKDSTLGLTSPTWIDPLSSANYCSSLNTIVFNAATSSYDGNGMGGVADLGSGKTAQQLTDQVGDDEGYTGKNWFMGMTDGLCTSKLLSGLGSAFGICPEEPSQKGTYNIAGTAWFANTNKIRSDFTPKASDARSLKVQTFGVQLASSSPRINVSVDGKPVTIIPAYRLDYGDKGTGTLVDFKIIQQTPTEGTYFVNWEDSNQGGDFDQDVWGVIKYKVVGSSLQVTTDVLGAATANPQGFGYVISGTSQDGVHFHSGYGGFNYTDPTGVTGCSNCQVSNAPVSYTYTVTGTAGNQLPEPLWLAAKWGGFKDLDGSGKPDKVEKWDRTTLGGAEGSDGIPDNYFYVQNPRALESALQRAFTEILATASSSSVATNSTSLNDGSRIYQARFNSNGWSGELLSYRIDDQGVIAATPEWDAGKLLTARTTDRVIYTYNDDKLALPAGVTLRWSNLTTPQQTAMNRSTFGVDLTGRERGADRLAWIRGDRSQEGNSVGKLRPRPSTILGDIVNSNPNYVGVPAAGYIDTDYVAFRAAYKDRQPMIYVGSNGGMVHGFSAETGQELMAYMPAAVLPETYRLADQNYVHRYYVDGSPEIRDVKVNGNWRTMLIGGLRAGGQGIYALDVTDPLAFREDNASSVVKWEFTDKDDPDLGFTFGQPRLVQLANGKWAAIFGNGYNNADGSPSSFRDPDTALSSTGRGYLYIALLDRPDLNKAWVAGTDYYKIEVPVGSTADSNGLAEVFTADTNFDGKVDTVYAGDLKGNLWKFDLSSTNPADWKLANAAKPIFKTPGNQPITGDIEAMKHPSGGVMVFFGTGRYLQPTDPAMADLQAFYGVLDMSDDTTVAISQLVKQEILEEKSVSGNSWRRTSTNPVDYLSGKRGWYMDLKVKDATTLTGERVIYAPILSGGRIIFTTMIPSTQPCDRGGDSWLMELNALSGTPLSLSPFDVNKDKYFNGGDLVTWSGGGSSFVSGRKSEVGITPRPTVIRGNEKTEGSPKEFKVVSGSSGATESIAESRGARSGRISWRDVMK